MSGVAPDLDFPFKSDSEPGGVLAFSKASATRICPDIAAQLNPEHPEGSR
eukprot:CAMPEP_0184327128 /NCGR_PEP_ID=MMETSP1049-20130417/142930_1 /TAXON_ID=77928 /ORGANISM="Proteomonas sulcata, Strain CCMP704" /LENGTH=49 /DNA_ID=CAMNT_0026649365 /DNA_START=3134 /DNA_END=3283 /DNA_ORIENTATION=-